MYDVQRAKAARVAAEKRGEDEEGEDEEGTEVHLHTYAFPHYLTHSYARTPIRGGSGKKRKTLKKLM
jgi:hypothetical protein